MDYEMNLESLQRFRFPVFNSIKELSNRLFLSEKLLFNLSMYTSRYYKTFTIPKKHKEERIINSPKYALRVIQSWILVNILYKVHIHDVAMGFRRGEAYGIKPNAYSHLNNNYVLKMDLKDFFTSIKRGKVYSVFKSLGYSQFMANILTNYCTYNGYLPQGASTSPYLSNLAFLSCDNKIKNYCSNNGIIYTRYADDLTFSSNRKSVLEDLKDIVKEIVEQEGFTLNEKKTRIMKPSGRKIVTGIIINNDILAVPRNTKRDVRAMIHHDIIKRAGDLSPATLGYLAFIKFIEPDRYEKLLQYIENLKKKKCSTEKVEPI